MSSGPSLANAKPRSGRSSCIEDTPISHHHAVHLRDPCVAKRAHHLRKPARMENQPRGVFHGPRARFPRYPQPRRPRRDRGRTRGPSRPRRAARANSRRRRTSHRRSAFPATAKARRSPRPGARGHAAALTASSPWLRPAAAGTRPVRPRTRRPSGRARRARTSRRTGPPPGRRCPPRSRPARRDAAAGRKRPLSSNGTSANP